MDGLCSFALTPVSIQQKYFLYPINLCGVTWRLASGDVWKINIFLQGDYGNGLRKPVMRGSVGLCLGTPVSSKSSRLILDPMFECRSRSSGLEYMYEGGLGHRVPSTECEMSNASSRQNDPGRTRSSTASYRQHGHHAQRTCTHLPARHRVRLSERCSLCCRL